MEASDQKEQSSPESPERLQEAMETEQQEASEVAAQESQENSEEATEEARAGEQEPAEKIKDDELSTKDSISELSMSNTQRQTDSPASVANSEHSSRPNKRKRKGTPTRHLEVSQTESQSDREREEVLSENLAGSPKNEIPIVLPDEAASEEKHEPAKSKPKKYAAPRLDLFGPPQHYMELFGPPVRQRTENCSVVIRGIGEEELYCGPGDKDPGEIVIPVRNTV